jgi:subtilisin family serine protease
MTKRFQITSVAGLAVLSLLLAGAWSLFSGAPPDSMRFTTFKGAPCLADEVLVKFKPAANRADIHRLLTTSRTFDLETLSGIGVHRLGLAPGADLASALAGLRRDPDVAFAEPDYCLRLASTISNDPYFSFQWALRNTGQPLGPPSLKIPSGKPGADIKAAEAWDLVPTGAPTIVGVVDTGVDLTQPDLADHIVSPGIDFPNNDFSAQDDHGHGTHVAGIIAAVVNNGLGVAGVNPNARILPAKVFNRNAVGLTSWVANGIIWAAANGARVINMSLGGRDVVVNQTLELAIKFAYDRNVVLVAAAGNDGTAGVWYPAAYDDYVLAAAATDQNDQYVSKSMTDGAFGSNFGPEVDVAAPGLDILSTWGIGLYQRGHPGFPGYVYDWGTSMSTAFVSGLASLIISSRPELTNRQVMTVIRLSADDVNADILPGRDDFLGYGRINALRAIQLAAVIDRLAGGEFIRLIK